MSVMSVCEVALLLVPTLFTCVLTGGFSLSRYFSYDIPNLFGRCL